MLSEGSSSWWIFWHQPGSLRLQHCHGLWGPEKAPKCCPFKNERRTHWVHPGVMHHQKRRWASHNCWMSISSFNLDCKFLFSFLRSYLDFLHNHAWLDTNAQVWTSVDCPLGFWLGNTMVVGSWWEHIHLHISLLGQKHFFCYGGHYRFIQLIPEMNELTLEESFTWLAM